MFLIGSGGEVSIIGFPWSWEKEIMQDGVAK